MEALARRQALPHTAEDAAEAQAVGEARQAEGQQWAEGQRTSRQHLETLSLTLHPFHIVDSTPQTSDQVASQLQVHVEAIEA
jgi:hypothetical protein